MTIIGPAAGLPCATCGAQAAKSSGYCATHQPNARDDWDEYGRKLRHARSWAEVGRVMKAERPVDNSRRSHLRFRSLESFTELAAAPGWFLAWLFTFGRMGKPLLERVYEEGSNTFALPPIADIGGSASGRVSGCHVGGPLPLHQPIPPESQITNPVPPQNVLVRR